MLVFTHFSEIVPVMPLTVLTTTETKTHSKLILLRFPHQQHSQEEKKCTPGFSILARK